ncbi:sigma-70 family RNA polymerase sigma factor [uncultured Legionella sp.]|uniref:sigma-70 family RNA polymerase sigma factor n=1 Tax=uncultured Legionella sp. TaxID=210934 RepID=UPI00260B798F|nr:sigma-70 family RNA polymerase sigma factor [uncultured Legionella sp.]
MNNDASCTDECLVELARNGNKQACNRLLERYNHKVQQIICFYISDQNNAKDLAQEVLLKVYRHLHYFKEESRFSTWLYKITQNTIKNYYRTKSLQLDSEAHYIEEQYSIYYSSPEHQLINLELNTQIENAVARLSEELRLCYGLHVFEGHKYDDIAKKLDCPIGTVRSRIYRARKLLTHFVDQKQV